MASPPAYYAAPQPVAPAVVYATSAMVVEPQVALAMATPVEANTAAPSLNEMCEVFKQQLGVKGTIKEVIQKTAEQLGVDDAKGTRSLVETATECYAIIGRNGV